MNSTSRGCEIGEQGREVAGLRRSTGREVDPEADPELGRDDLRERGLAEAGGAGEEHVIERLAALPCGRDEHAEIGAQLRLADELGQPLRPQRRLGLADARLGADQAFVHGAVLTQMAQEAHARLR